MATLEDTLAPDGDALDVILLTDLSLQPGCIVKVKLIGLIEMTDQGVQDNKVIAIMEGTEGPKNIPYSMSTVLNFLSEYKEGTEVKHMVQNAETALEEIDAAQKAFWRRT
jgi:inorganic pyrophosphatase